AVHVETADTTELFPLFEKPALLVEDLDPHVSAVGDKQAPAGVERQGVRLPNLAGRRAQLAPRLDELPVFRELHDARDRIWRGLRVLTAMSVRDEDVALRRGEGMSRLVQVVRW